ncbi:MAG: response regulator transcription factor [Firmicutes bacterium]|nr:response regulator transcription factor [Bacillota bacterium]
MIITAEPSTRLGITSIFSSEEAFAVVGSIPPKGAEDSCVNKQPDAVLIDITDNPTKYGSVISQIKKQCPYSIIIALVENEHYGLLSEVIGQGANSCLHKGIIRSCLVKAVELACRADIIFLPGTYKRVISEVRPDNKLEQLRKSVTTETLTKREMEILHLMSNNLTNREIASKLYISEPTVKSHVSSILSKLGQKNRAQAVVHSYKIGLINKPLVDRLCN